MTAQNPGLSEELGKKVIQSAVCCAPKVGLRGIHKAVALGWLSSGRLSVQVPMHRICSFLAFCAWLMLQRVIREKNEGHKHIL